MKKVVSLIVTIFMLTIFSTTAFAAESTNAPHFPGLSKEYNTYTIDDIKINSSNNPKAWPGSGPAAQVSQVDVVAYGWFDNTYPEHEGNFGVVVRIMGHGRAKATFNGNKVDDFKIDPIILTGTLVDGWYYYYDCGTVTPGEHRFDITVKSINSPYTEKSTWATFTITESEDN